MTVPETSTSSTTGDLVPATAPTIVATPAGVASVAAGLLVQLDAEHPVLGGRSDRERLLAAA